MTEKSDIHTNSDQVMIGKCWSRSMMVLTVHRILTQIVTGKQRTTSSMTQDQSVDQEDYEKFLFFVIASIYLQCRYFFGSSFFSSGFGVGNLNCISLASVLSHVQCGS